MNVRRDLHRLVDDLLDDDPRRALIAYRRMTDEELPWLEQRVVSLARREDWNWAKIGRLLGRSRQSMHGRFGKLQAMLRSDPLVEKHRAEAEYIRVTRPQPREDEEVIAW